LASVSIFVEYNIVFTYVIIHDEFRI